MKNLSPEQKINLMKLIFIIITFIVISLFAFSCVPASSNAENCTEVSPRKYKYEILVYSHNKSWTDEYYSDSVTFLPNGVLYFEGKCRTCRDNTSQHYINRPYQINLLY